MILHTGGPFFMTLQMWMGDCLGCSHHEGGAISCALFVNYTWACALQLGKTKENLRDVSYILLLLLFILTANGFVPGGSGTTIQHNTQNNTTLKHNSTQNYTKDTYYTINTITINLKLIN
jgi:hypothetical protein